MNFTINLNNQPYLMTIEIYNKEIYWMLPAKPYTTYLLKFKFSSKQFFRLRHMSPETSGCLESFRFRSIIHLFLKFFYFFFLFF